MNILADARKAFLDDQLAHKDALRAWLEGDLPEGSEVWSSIGGTASKCQLFTASDKFPLAPSHCGPGWMRLFNLETAEVQFVPYTWANMLHRTEAEASIAIEARKMLMRGLWQTVVDCQSEDPLDGVFVEGGEA